MDVSTGKVSDYYMIESLTNVTSTRLIWNTYYAYVESKLRYGIIFWGREKKIHSDISTTIKGSLD